MNTIFCLNTFFNLLLLIQVAFLQNYSIDNIELNWIDNGESTNIRLTNINISVNNWFAFGLSNNQEMVRIIKFYKL